MNATEVAQALREVYDPELGIDIVSLGLVYGIHTDNGIRIELTTTTAACPMGAALLEMTEAVLRQRFPGQLVRVEAVFDPAWDAEMLTGEARSWLGLPPRPGKN
jgi:metal-sulfur cluster biosynthetic enzyme